MSVSALVEAGHSLELELAELRAEVVELRGDVAELGRHVRGLEALAAGDTGNHSRRFDLPPAELELELRAAAESALFAVRVEHGAYWRR